MDRTMHRIAIVIYSRLEGSGQSTVYRALMFAQELHRHGDDAVVIFDGGGTVSACEIAAADHRLRPLLENTRPLVRGLCRHCARSYGVLDTALALELALIGDDRGHASLRSLLYEGRQIVTF
jgi:hypothetical protein